MLQINKNYNMDCLEGMKLLDDNCIDLVVTSPPYDELRKYNGYSFDFEDNGTRLIEMIVDKNRSGSVGSGYYWFSGSEMAYYPIV